jgi:Tol biopolymer transport system component
MKVQRILLLALLLLVTLAACSPGHLGSNEIAFVRSGQLWTIDPDGANPFAIVAQGPPVVGYSWSPNHQIVAFRTLDEDFARTAAARQLSSNASMIGDVPSTLNTVGVDGGTPIPIAFSSPGVRYSNPIWNANGTRLVYRQTGTSNPPSPDQDSWVVAQSDQPGGIAAKVLPGTYAIPSFSYNTQKTIGISRVGIFTTTLAGSGQQFLTGPLPGHPLPASLERVLWQPGHQDAYMLYAVDEPKATNTNTSTVQLMLRALNGQTTMLATCACTQFAWSPDGNSVLYRSGASYTVLNISNRAAFNITDEEDSVPYWSPDSKFLLLDGTRTLTLVQIAQRQQNVLLSSSESDKTFPLVPTITSLLQPVANSPWAADSRHFLFLTHDRLSWQGKQLSKGLYTVALDGNGQVQGVPSIVDKGNDAQAGWSYQDANTSFLY